MELVLIAAGTALILAQCRYSAKIHDRISDFVSGLGSTNGIRKSTSPERAAPPFPILLAKTVYDSQQFIEHAGIDPDPFNRIISRMLRAAMRMHRRRSDLFQTLCWRCAFAAGSILVIGTISNLLRIEPTDLEQVHDNLRLAFGAVVIQNIAVWWLQKMLPGNWLVNLDITNNGKNTFQALALVHSGFGQEIPELSSIQQVEMTTGKCQREARIKFIISTADEKFQTNRRQLHRWRDAMPLLELIIVGLPTAMEVMIWIGRSPI